MANAERDLFPLSRLTEPFSQEGICYADADLLVVDKPVGLSMIAPERGGDDLVSRLRAGDASSYLAVHEHLDRDISGIVALSRRPDINAALAQQVLDGRVHRTWLAALTSSHLKPRGEATVSLTQDRRGLVRKALPGDRKPQRISFKWKVLRSQADRSLVEIRTDRGGSRQVRAALAARGWPIVGDNADKGSWRLMLHALELEMHHPSTGKRLQLRTAWPTAFDLWLRGENPVPPTRDLVGLFQEAGQRRHLLAASTKVGAYRLFHGEGEGLPGLDVDRYGHHVIVWVDEQYSGEWRERILEAIWQFSPKGVYLKVRPRHASRIADSRRADLAPPRAVRGEDGPEEVIVAEGGMQFAVRLGDGLATGLFLDQRENRRWIGSQCLGQSLLNLFAYTCSFTVAAALGGASQTTSVDSSSRALEQGARNLRLNGFEGDHHKLVCDDVLSWIPRARRKGLRFDRIVLDPPSFSTTHRSRFSFANDFVGVAEGCFGLLAEGGLLLACTNCRSIGMRQLRRLTEQAAKQAGRGIMSFRELPSQIDFPVARGLEPHMKALAVDVD